MIDDLAPQPDPIRRIAILGTGLIGSSLGLALRRAGFEGAIFGWDRDAGTLKQARAFGAVDPAPADPAADDPFIYALASDLIVLAGPVYAIADWLEQLSPVLSGSQLVTDVGSVKSFLMDRARASYNGAGQPSYLPGHPMAGKEQGGCLHAEGTLFQGAAWFFTPEASPEGNAPQSDRGKGADHSTVAGAHLLVAHWREWVRRIGAHPVDLSAERHDLLCAWISHLPQMAATALSAVLERSFKETFAPELKLHGSLQALGGRALREMTRLGASPYSMWRDIAHVNAPAIATALLAFEQELTHIRENLKTPELREVFEQANAFRPATPVKP
jgi:prephenate dehydrogenase